MSLSEPSSQLVLLLFPFDSRPIIVRSLAHVSFYFYSRLELAINKEFIFSFFCSAFYSDICLSAFLPHSYASVKPTF